MDLNSNHAHWCHFSWIWYHFSRQEYEQALERVSRVNVPGNFWIPLTTAVIIQQLGRFEDAQYALTQLLAMGPGFASHARSNIEAWHFASGLADTLLDGLHIAGLALD